MTAPDPASHVLGVHVAPLIEVSFDSITDDFAPREFFATLSGVPRMIVLRDHQDQDHQLMEDSASLAPDSIHELPEETRAAIHALAAVAGGGVSAHATVVEVVLPKRALPESAPEGGEDGEPGPSQASAGADWEDSGSESDGYEDELEGLPGDESDAEGECEGALSCVPRGEFCAAVEAG